MSKYSAAFTFLAIVFVLAVGFSFVPHLVHAVEPLQGDPSIGGGQFPPPAPTPPEQVSASGQPHLSIVTDSLPVFGCTVGAVCPGSCEGSFTSSGSGFGWSASGNTVNVTDVDLSDGQPHGRYRTLNITLPRVDVDDDGSGTGWSKETCDGTGGPHCGSQTGTDCAGTINPGTTVWSQGSGDTLNISGTATNELAPNGSSGTWGGEWAYYVITSQVCDKGYVLQKTGGVVRCVTGEPPPFPPSVTCSVTPGSITTGGTAVFSVIATGGSGSGYEYQWQYPTGDAACPNSNSASNAFGAATNCTTAPLASSVAPGAFQVNVQDSQKDSGSAICPGVTVSPPNTYFTCVKDACEQVQGTGTSNCLGPDDTTSCNPAATPTPTYGVCNAQTGACQEVSGTGTSQCTAADAATACPQPTHLACLGQSCTTVTGPGSNSCTSDANCVAPLSCSPYDGSAAAGSPATTYAIGGTSPYSWNAPNGNPASALAGSAQFSTTYPSSLIGTNQTVTVTDAGKTSASCFVSVQKPGVPDLIISSISAPAGPGSYNFTATIENTGSAAAGPSHTSFFYYETPGDQSTKQEINPLEETPAVAANAFTSANSASWSIDPGTHAIEACADAQNEVGEAHADNCVTQNFTVGQTSGDGAPTAVASASFDGTNFFNNLIVTQGQPVTLWLSAQGSSDPLGWTDGMTSGGQCDWNVDLDNPFAVQRTVNDPAAPSNCLEGPLQKTFNDPPGTYTYNVLRLINAQGFQSALASITVTVVNSATPSCLAFPSTAPINSNVTFSAPGGVEANSYQWNAPGASPVTGAGATFTTSYATPGPKTVTISGGNGGQGNGGGPTGTCTVLITSPLALSCTGPTAAVPPGVSLVFSATGGATNNYQWSAPGSSDPLDTGTTLVTSYQQTGVQTATVTNGTDTASCTVDIEKGATQACSTFTVSPNKLFIPPAKSVAINWACGGTSACQVTDELTDQVVGTGLTGSASSMPTSTRMYCLTCGGNPDPVDCTTVHVFDFSTLKEILPQ